MISVITIAFYALRKIQGAGHKHQPFYAILAFWLSYILTRPLGASIGDFLTQAKDDGGLGLGPTVTTIIFTSTILVLVVYLAFTKKDELPVEIK
jgi:uncharacterized membrane-anchored protein